MNNSNPKDCIADKSNISWKEKMTIHPILRLTFKGLIVSLPFIIVLFLVSLLFRLILQVISPVRKILFPMVEDPGIFIHGISIVVLLVVFYSVGKIIDSRNGKKTVRYVEKSYLMKIPLYSTIRELVHQFSGMKKMPFSDVVLIDPYNSGVLLMGFITSSYQDKIYSVFVPTSPNPANGQIYHLPKAQIRFLPIKPETAMRTIVGMGTGASCLFEEHLEEKDLKSSENFG